MIRVAQGSGLRSICELEDRPQYTNHRNSKRKRPSMHMTLSTLYQGIVWCFCLAMFGSLIARNPKLYILNRISVASTVPFRSIWLYGARSSKPYILYGGTIISTVPSRSIWPRGNFRIRLRCKLLRPHIAM